LSQRGASGFVVLPHYNPQLFSAFQHDRAKWWISKENVRYGDYDWLSNRVFSRIRSWDPNVGDRRAVNFAFGDLSEHGSSFDLTIV
jgi:hypothetical protein